MADILFTHSYFLTFDPKEYKAMMPYPPLGTLYAASVARQAGHSVALFDSMLAGSEEEIVGHIRKHKPRIVVIYDDDFNYLTKMCLTRMREAAFKMAGLAKSEGAVVVAHGSDSVDHLEKYFSHNVDFVICGEGEQTLIDTLDHIIRGRPKETINGLVFTHQGSIRRNPERPPLKNIDSLPFPAVDLIDVERYRSVWKKRHGYFSLNMVTTRGCPFHCNWCAKPIYGQVYNCRSPQNVVREMKWLRENLKPDHIWFCDDIFGLKPGWVGEFSRHVVGEDAILPFKCQARVDLLLKENAVENLRNAGCETVWVGAESGSQKILDAMEKGTTVQQIYEATRKLKNAGIRVGFFLQYGYPGETQEDIDMTLRMVKDCLPDEIGVSVSYPLPGTKFYENVRTQLGEKHNWTDSQDLAMMFRGTYQPDFYRLLHKVTHKKLRIWQGIRLVRESLVRPWQLSPRRIRGIAAGMWHGITMHSHQRRLDVLALPHSRGTR